MKRNYLAAILCLVAINVQAQTPLPLAWPTAMPGTTTTLKLPTRLDREPLIRALVTGMVGYARGSYIDGDSLIAGQILEGLGDKYTSTRTVLPDGRILMASLNPADHGRTRTALLMEKGKLQAIGLVNGHCGVSIDDKPAVCLPEAQTVLTIFQMAGAKPEAAEPLVLWGRQLPELLALLAERDGPDSPDVQRIATVEYVTGNPDAPGWRDDQLPPGFPASLTHLVPKASELRVTAADGILILPKGLAGKPSRPAWQIAEMSEDETLPDTEVVVHSLTDARVLVDKYVALVAPFVVESNPQEGWFTGKTGEAEFDLEIEDKGGLGSFIRISVWRR